MTKDELKQIYYLNKEVIMWENELERLEHKSLISANRLTGMPYGGGKSDKVGELVIEQESIKEIIQGKLVEIQLQRKRILEYINHIEDSMMRQIIFLRNVSCMNWEQISIEIGGGNSENSVKQAYSRFLKGKNKI